MSGAQGGAPGVSADDGAAASGCGVRRASTFNPPATRGEEGRMHRIMKSTIGGKQYDANK